MDYRIDNVGCVGGGEAFLITTEGKNALVDTGFLCTAKELTSKVMRILGERKLDYILLTHSHYDHVSGVVELKKAYPDAVVVSSEHAAKVFEKPNAIKTMKTLNRAAAFAFRKNRFYMNGLKGLHTDLIVKEGDEIDLGGMVFKVIETPSHTRDCIAFWCESERFLISNESMGVIASADVVVPQCLVSHRKGVDFIRLSRELDPKYILVSHYGLLKDDECARMMDVAERCALEMKDLIMKAHDEGKTPEEIMAITKETFWTGPIRQGQPEKAFDMNNKYIVKAILSEYP